MRSRRIQKKEETSSRPLNFFEERKGNPISALQEEPFFKGPVNGNSDSLSKHFGIANTIQRKVGDTFSNSPSLSNPVPNQPISTATGNFIVDDTEIPSTIQMRKSDFLDRLKIEICSSVDEALSGSSFTSSNCPYIKAAFERHQFSTANELEQLIYRYAPSALNAGSVEGLIATMKMRVFISAKNWLTRGGNLDEISAWSGDPGDTMDSSIARIFLKGPQINNNTIPHPTQVMHSLGKGDSIASGSRRKMESAFESDFSDVEIHTDKEASRLSKKMNARAFTVGKHIAFSGNEYNPGTIEGDALLAHELAHVKQQSNGKASDKSVLDKSAYGSLEKDADYEAIRAVTEIYSGKDPSKLPKRNIKRIKSGLSIQRCGSSSSKRKGSTKDEIIKYVTEINTKDPKTRGNEDGKNLARDTINEWKKGGPAAILPLKAKMNLIRELINGVISEGDQTLILDLIEQSEVVHVVNIVKDPDVVGSVAAKFNEVNKQRFAAIKAGRAKEKDTSQSSFRSDDVKDTVDEAYANAIAKGKGEPHLECISTVRYISIKNLYKGKSQAEQDRIKTMVDKECAAHDTSMADAMTGMLNAGYVEDKFTVEPKKIKKEVQVNIEHNTKTVKFTSSYYPGTLGGKVWENINARTKGKEGWHAFGLAIMDSFHSVVLLVNVRPGGPFLYFVDQNDRATAGVDTTRRLEGTIPGVQQLAPGQLDPYLEFYSDVNYPGYFQHSIDKKEAKGRSVKEADLEKMQPNSQMDLWKLSTTKKPK